MTTPTLGGVHHTATVVDDAVGYAERYVMAFGWRRLLCVAIDGDDAARAGRLLGIASVATATIVMLESPDAAPGRVELVEFRDCRGDSLACGLTVLSFRVADARQSWTSLVEAGFQEVLAPSRALVGDWPVVVASVRSATNQLIEVMQLESTPRVAEQATGRRSTEPTPTVVIR